MWVKKRHTFYIFMVKRIVWGILKIKYNFKYTKCKEKGPFLIIGNHSIAHDPFLYAWLFKGSIYFMTTDELYRMGLLSKWIKHALAPIPKSKSLRDTSAIKLCFEVAKANKNIAIYPEGATTYSGELCTIDPSIVKLAKKIKYKIAIVNVEGGFQSRPKFGTGASRRGKLKSYVKKIITIEELEALSNDELFDIIKENIKVPLVEGVNYKSKARAHYLETTLYYCDKCDSFNTTHSHIHDFYCKKCGVKYNVAKDLKLFMGEEETSISYLFKKQEEKINSLSLEDISNLVYEDNATLYEVVNYKKIPKSSGELKLINSSIVVGAYTFKLEDIVASCTTGPDMVDIYVGDKVYQIRGEGRFCALKYMNIVYRYKNLINNDDSKYIGV